MRSVAALYHTKIISEQLLRITILRDQWATLHAVLDLQPTDVKRVKKYLRCQRHAAHSNLNQLIRIGVVKAHMGMYTVRVSRLESMMDAINQFTNQKKPNTTRCLSGSEDTNGTQLEFQF